MYQIKVLASEMESKKAELDAKILAYQAAQNYQLEHGGPGPAADFEVMKIVNEHNGEYELVEDV